MKDKMEPPTGPPPDGYRHAWFSAQMCYKFGSCEYRNDRGDVTELTASTSGVKNPIAWKDAEYKGLVRADGYLGGDIKT